MLLAQRLAQRTDCITDCKLSATEGAPAESATAEGALTTSFVLATTHLKAGVSSQYEAVRAKQAATLLTDLNRFCADEGGVVAVALAGDLNADRSTPPHPASWHPLPCALSRWLLATNVVRKGPH